MKTHIALTIASLVSFLMTPAMAFASVATPAVVATYECGADRSAARTVRVLTDATNYSISISYLAKNVTTGKSNVVNIVSQPVSIDDARSLFGANEKESFAKDSLSKLTGLPANSVAFAGFHYPSGKMYVAAEGDTNEEGFIFAADEALLLGERTATVAHLFWSDFHQTEVSTESCSLVP